MRVDIDEPYYLARFECSNRIWRGLGGGVPAACVVFEGHRLDGDEQPVGGISREEIAERLGKKGLRLPTEEEWVYAARLAAPDSESVAWDSENIWGPLESIPPELVETYGLVPGILGSDPYAASSPVGALGTGATGFADLFGNVEELCADTRLLARVGEEAGLMRFVRNIVPDDFVSHGGYWGATRPVSGPGSATVWTPKGFVPGFVGFRPAHDVR